MVQKAVEMGASRLQPVLTRYTQVARVNLDRMQANAIEAAEQCGILTLPDIQPPVNFVDMLAARDPVRLLVFCDEEAEPSSSAPKAASPTRSARRCSSFPTPCASRSAPASCGPTLPPLPRWR